MLIEAPPLTHRFTALYQDGTTFTQPLDDRCANPRPDGSGSAFTDVKVDQVVAFYLESGSEADRDAHLYLVDLRDGHFEIDGRQFCLGPQEIDPHLPLTLVYFRRIKQSKTTLADGRVRASTHRSYHLGYQQLGRAAHTIDVGHEVFLGEG